MLKDIETFAIHTLGCKVNTYESQVIINDLLSEGLVQVDFDQKADIYIINTCTVTNTADAKSRNIINRAKKTNPKAIIVAAGCYIQTADKKDIDKLGIDIVIGNKYKNNLVKLIKDYLKDNQKIYQVENLLLEKEFEECLHSSFENRTRAFIKIQDGCNFMCSYCTIPFARGRQRSASDVSIIDQIKDFIKRGFKEIVLTGVNTAGYEYQDVNFYGLLKKINALEGDFRIRISSVEPFQITDEIIELIKNNPSRFCNHWHLCLQSGSDEVLKSMNRKYTTKQYQELVDKIRLNNELVCISTDLIVGYPTETDDDFNQSMAFIKSLPMSYCHIFTYSKRRKTAASRLKDLNGKIKQERFNIAERINKELYHSYIKQFIGLEVKVLFEKYENGIYIGKNSEYIDVMYKSNDKNLLNKFLVLKVSKILNNTLILE